MSKRSTLSLIPIGAIAVFIIVIFFVSTRFLAQSPSSIKQSVTDKPSQSTALNNHMFHEEITYYPIFGTTKDELISEMAQSGIADEAGNAWYAYTSWYSDFTHEPMKSNGLCAVGNVNVTTDISIILPQWEDDPKDGSALSLAWDAYVSKLLAHENKHRDLFKHYGEMITETLMNIPPQKDCDTLSWVLNEQRNTLLEECQAKDKQLDSETAHGVNDGVVFN